MPVTVEGISAPAIVGVIILGGATLSALGVLYVKGLVPLYRAGKEIYERRKAYREWAKTRVSQEQFDMQQAQLKELKDMMATGLKELASVKEQVFPNGGKSSIPDIIANLDKKVEDVIAEQSRVKANLEETKSEQAAIKATLDDHTLKLSQLLGARPA